MLRGAEIMEKVPVFCGHGCAIVQECVCSDLQGHSKGGRQKWKPYFWCL